MGRRVQPPDIGYRAHGTNDRPAIVFGFGDLNEHAIRSGIAAIADLLGPGDRRAAGPLP
ncbi:hypothetical protein [Micromonospora psammae]|uniref:hypothetical protein n=1 Tax=Micromonospora sp. CPCC 205556 TaxID=3122398 RepID=UPI002FEF4B62